MNYFTCTIQHWARLLTLSTSLGLSLLGNSGTAYAATPAVATVPTPVIASAPSVPLEALQSFVAVYERIRLQHVDVKTDEQLLQLALQGLLLKLDPYSSYLDAQAMTALREDTQGEYSGIGVELVPEGNYLRVITPIDDSPADKAGILPGDWITKIQGKSVKGLDIHTLDQLMTGPTGSNLKLVILRNGEELNFNLTREVIFTDSVRGELMQTNVGYLRISYFQDHTGTDLEQQMQTLAKAGAQSWLLDLRNNPGGTLEAAVAVADAFLNEGVIVTTQARQQRANMRFDATSKDPSQGLPLVVLINNGSASASEIVAGAVKDHGRGQLVGNASFGKGSVQSVIALPQGAGIKLTTAYYFTPAGHNIHHKGILPDLEVDATKPLDETDIDLQLESALALLTGQNDGLKK
jgi:carboxyl-terminal processing protease